MQTPKNLQQGPPPFAPYIFPDVVSNAFGIQVSKAVLGDGVYNAFYNGNTNTPGSGLQPVHRDLPQLWPQWDGVHPPTSLVINVFPMDVHEHNGCTEIWPGSHLIPGVITDEMVEARSAKVPPIRAVAPKGSVIVRDLRLWHRGVPNTSDEFRHMIAMIHHIHWYGRKQKVLFETGCESAFVSEDLDHNVEFVDEPLDYLYDRRATRRNKT
jgi:ectoine hydroxylase-related dioxygenase (phytanoyl-CoA dioxygenase family)